jgi:hypothetical protein
MSPAGLEDVLVLRRKYAVKLRNLIHAGFAAALATTLVACGDDPAPQAPTPPPVVTPPPPAAPVLTKPTADGPAENEQLQTLRPTVRILNATADQSGTRTYEFQISDDPDFQPASPSDLAGPFKVIAAQAGIAEGGDGKTSFEVQGDLQPATRFYWRARARQGTTDGPWSDAATFRTLIRGYNRPGELYDPLTNASTVGNPEGSVTFVPGRGVVLNNNEARVRYILPQTITAGSFSLEADGIQNFSPGDKTKMLSMYNGGGDITTSDWRATVEKRDDGRVAWRFIAGETDSDHQIETTGNNERIRLNFNPGTTYFWRATWGGNFFNVHIKSGGENGVQIYDFGKHYAGTYAPAPHHAFLGSPIGRGGPNDASVVGVYFRNVFIGGGARPKPLSLGTALIEDPSQDPRMGPGRTKQ